MTKFSGKISARTRAILDEIRRSRLARKILGILDELLSMTKFSGKIQKIDGMAKSWVNRQQEQQQQEQQQQSRFMDRLAVKNLQ